MKEEQLPYKNALDIEANRKAIKNGKRERRGLLVIIIALITYTAHLTYKQHTIETCQAKLFTHITGQEAPTIAELEVIQNPKEYKARFKGCE